MEQQHHFFAGYNECAREVQMYLLQSNEVNPQVKARMLSHIATPSQNTSTSLSFPDELDEFSCKSHSYSPLASLYPSPPASPVGLSRGTSKSQNPIHDLSWSAYPTEKGRALKIIPKKEEKKIDQTNQELWRPWQNL